MTLKVLLSLMWTLSLGATLAARAEISSAPGTPAPSHFPGTSTVAGPAVPGSGESASNVGPPDEASESFWARINSTKVLQDPDRPRNFFFPQLFSLLLPGFDQILESQYPAVLFYSGVGALSLGTGIALARRLSDRALVSNASFDSRDNQVRGYLLALQYYQWAGGLSAYASFRSAVRTQQKHDKFMFLTHEETLGDILEAPFHFSEVLKPTTIIPLLVVTTLVVLSDTRHFSAGNLHFSDAAFSGAFSYNAGTHEEAVFRGWVMPVMYHYFDNRFLSNLGQSLLFAAAHLGTVDFPITQFLLGFYLGYLTQRNEWTITQSIFIHAWWDTIAFVGGYLESSVNPRRVVILPLVSAVF